MPKLRRGLFSLTVLIILLTGCNFICRAEESAEKGPAEIGDILYYSYDEDWKPGHAMLYVGWYPVREPKKENLRVIESMPPSEINQRGLVNESIDYIYDYARTWKEGLSAEQRTKISEFVISKTGLWRYCEDFDHTYQKGQDGIHCDCAGLCEAAYESIRLNPVWMEWPILWPEQQCNSRRMKPATPVPPEARLALSSTPKGYASDGDYGSGITMVEFWEGEPDDTPEERPGYRIGFDNHDTNVSGYYECAFPPGFELTKQGKIKVFDQAGNWKIGYGEFKMVDFITLTPKADWGSPPTRQPTILYSKWGTVSIELVEELQDGHFFLHTWRGTHTPDCWAYPEVVYETMDEQSVEFTKGICWDGLCDDAPEGCELFNTTEWNLCEDDVQADGIRTVRELIESCGACGQASGLLHVFDTRTGTAYGWFGGLWDPTYVPDVGTTLHLARFGYDGEVVVLPDTLDQTDPFWILRTSGGEWEQYVEGWMPESDDDIDQPPWSFRSSAWE